MPANVRGGGPALLIASPLGCTRTQGSGLPWLQRLGMACGGHPSRVLAIWAVLRAGLLAASASVSHTFTNNVDLSGTQSATGLSLLEENNPGTGGYSGLVVFNAQSGTLASNSTQVNDTITALGQLPHAVSASNPLAQSAPTLPSDGVLV